MDEIEKIREALDAMTIDIKFLKNRNCLEDHVFNDTDVNVAREINKISNQLTSVLKKVADSNLDTDND